jgi:hypothetical protein
MARFLAVPAGEGRTLMEYAWPELVGRAQRP